MRYARIYQYQIPTNKNWVWHKDIKSGFIVELKENQHFGQGEIAPLLGFSEETNEMAKAQLIEITKAWINHQDIAYQDLYPSVSFGFSSAIFELSNTFLTNSDVTNINFGAKLFNCDQTIIDNLTHNPKLQLIKIKLGDQNIEYQASIIQKLLTIAPQLKIRLDANQKLSFKQVLEFTKLISPYLSNIDYFEEPVKNPDEFSQLAIIKNYRLAIDETFVKSVKNDDYQSIVANPNFSVLIIKPTLIGDLWLIKKIIADAKSYRKQVVISSSFESSFTLNKLQIISQTLLPKSIPGLDTMFIYQKHLIDAFDYSNYPLPYIKLSDCKVCFSINYE